jgi:NACHT domain
MSKQKSDTPSHEAATTRRPWWIRVCRWLWHELGFVWGTLIVGIIIATIANLNTTTTDTPLAKLFIVHLAQTYPLPVWTSLGLLVTLTLLSWIGSRDKQVLPARPLPEQNRLRMLQRLDHTYRDLLAQSLDGAVWMELGLAEKPGAVGTTTQLMFHPLDGPEHDLPHGTSILRVYKESQGELLILGKPGAGKSTLLLSLALQLVGQAQHDATQLLPVIVPLASWAMKRQLFQDWSCKQIAELYNVPRQVCEQWMDQGQILLLLDGLDEMEAEARRACIAAINAYHRERMTPLVVCCREVEYADASKRQRLALQGAVIVRPLTKAQVDRHLVQLGPPVAALRKALKSSVALQELATTPLMLNILMLTYHGTSVRKLPTQGAALQQQVLDNYVQRMVERKDTRQLYTPKRTRQTLGWLALQLQGHSQIIFSAERLQPDWLPLDQRRWYTWLAVRLPGAFIGVLVGLLTAPLLITFDPGLLLQYSILSAFLGAVFSVPKVDAPTHGTQNHARMIFGRFTSAYLLASATLALVWGGAFLLNMHSRDMSGNWLLQCMYSSVSGLIIGLSCLLLMILLPPTRPEQISAFPQSRGWWSSLRHIGLAHGRRALLAAIIFGLGIWLSDALNAGLSDGLSNALSAGLNYGLLSLMLSVILGMLNENIDLVERLRWTRKSLLRSLFNSKHLRGTLLLVFISLALFGLSQGLGPLLNQGLRQGLSWGLSWGLAQGLGWGLSWGLSCWFLLGLFGGISHEQLEDEHRRLFNQGTHDSLRNSALMSVIAALLIEEISVLSWGLSYELSYGLNYGVSWGLSHELSTALSYGLITGLNQGVSHAWLFAISGGLLVGATLCGGMAALRHYVLRFLLWRGHIFPWRAQLFLEDACRRILLRCVNGKYGFTHGLLLGYFADDAVKTQEQGLPKSEDCVANMPADKQGDMAHTRRQFQERCLL